MANLRVVNLAGELILETLLCEENDYGGPDLAVYLGKLVQEHTGFPSFRIALVAAGKSWHQLGQPSEVQAVFNQAVNDFSADLLTAIRARDFDAARQILEKHQDPNCCDGDDCAARVACIAGSGDILEILLQAGADRDARNANGEGLLHTAAAHGSMECARLLLDLNADIESSEESGFTALHMAARSGQMDMFRHLLKAGAKRDALDQTGASVLHTAAEHGQVQVMSYLLDLGMNIELTEEAGATPLYVAAESGQLEAVRFLIQAGAYIDTEDESGATPIYTASQNGHADVVDCLVKAGADKEKCKRYGGSPLSIATWRGHFDVLDALDEDLESFKAHNSGFLQELQALLDECGGGSLFSR